MKKEEISNRVNGFGALFRFITPLFITIGLFVLGEIRKDIQDVSEKVYRYQTNAELHIPRGEFERIRVEIVEMRQEVVALLRESKRQ